MDFCGSSLGTNMVLTSTNEQPRTTKYLQRWKEDIEEKRKMKK